MCDNQDRNFHSGIWCFAKVLSMKDKKAKSKQGSSIWSETSESPIPATDEGILHHVLAQGVGKSMSTRCATNYE
jgi:hypothetical protein